jgi:hypothetical protein
MVDGLGKSGRFGLGDREMRLLILLLLAAPCAAEEIPLSEVYSRIIPLDEVWTLGQRGTKSLQSLEPNFNPQDHLGDIHDLSQHSEVEKLLMGLKIKTRDDEAGKAFVVQGDPTKALEEAANVLAGKKPLQDWAKAGDAYAIFYALSNNYNIYIESAAQEGSRLILSYKIVTRSETGLAPYVAMIPFKVPKSGVIDIRLAVSRPQPESLLLRPASASAELVVCKPAIIRILE